MAERRDYTELCTLYWAADKLDMSVSQLYLLRDTFEDFPQPVKYSGEGKKRNHLFYFPDLERFVESYRANH